MADKRRFFDAYLSTLARIKETGEKPTLLLHCCCAPCAASCLEELAEHFTLTLFYYNPNIPTEEYTLRKSELERLKDGLGISASLYDAPYEPEAFYAFAKSLAHLPEGGERCDRCFALRLCKTAEVAATEGFDYFATTLTLSPMKDAAKLNALGQRFAEERGVLYLVSDFKKGGGSQRSLANAKKFDLYRQNYCGCAYSLAEVNARRKAKEQENA